MNTIKLINCGETVRYRGNFKGYWHQVSDYHIALIRNDVTVEKIATGKTAAASLITHLHAAFGERVTFTDVAAGVVDGVSIYQTMAKIKGFGGKHLVGYVAKLGKFSYHMDIAEYNQRSREFVAGQLDEEQKRARLAALVIEKKRKVDTAKAIEQAEAEAVRNGLKFTAQSIHEKFGFCLVGIKAFADACGLDPRGAYTCAEIVAAYNLARFSGESTTAFVFDTYNDEITVFVRYCKRAHAA